MGVRPRAARRSRPAPSLTTDIGLVERDDHQHVAALVGGDFVISGIHALRNSSAPMRPPCWLMLLAPAHGLSWPSLQRFGVMKPKRGVVFRLLQVLGQVPSGGGGAVRSERAEGDDIGVTVCRVVDDGVKPDEGVVPAGVLVSRGRHLGRVGGADRRVPAVGATARVGRAAIARRRVPHVLFVRAPRRDVGGLVRRILGVELVGDCRHRGRVDAALTVHLARIRAWSGSGVPGSTLAKAKPLSAQSAWVSSVGDCPETWEM